MSSQIVGSIDVSSSAGRANVMLTRGWVRMYNHSIFGLSVTFSDGEQYYIPPQSRRTFCHDQPAAYFDWSHQTITTIALATQASSMLVIETLELSDIRLENDLHLMGGVQNVGNSTPLPGATASVANDGNPAGTEFIEASQSSIKRVSVTNDGYMLLAPLLSGVNKIVQEWFPVDAASKDWALIIRASDNAIFLQNRTDNITAALWSPAGGQQLFGPMTISRDAHISTQIFVEMDDSGAGGHIWRINIEPTTHAVDFRDQTTAIIPLQLLPDGSVVVSAAGASTNVALVTPAGVDLFVQQATPTAGHKYNVWFQLPFA